MVVLLSKFKANKYSQIACTHTTGSSNREALQVTKGLAHEEHPVEQHALPNANTPARPSAQKEGVQDRQRERSTQAWGEKYLRLLLFSLYLKRYP
jgi:hypothetical protein